jgi:hypothetical protein
MKRNIIFAIIFLFAVIGFALQVGALPPLPSSTGTTYTGTGVANITTTNVIATTANITGNLTANVLSVSTATITAANITQIKTAVAADNTLSGTPIIITVYDAATNTPYYFKAYPTKP